MAVPKYTVEPPIKDPLRKVNKGHTSGPHSHSRSLLSSEERTAFQQKTKMVGPNYVYIQSFRCTEQVKWVRNKN